jgi:hypothetical protein
MQTCGMAIAGKALCRRASRMRFSGLKADGAAWSLWDRIGGTFCGNIFDTGSLQMEVTAE